MLDTVDPLPSKIPQVSGAGPRHPIADGQVKKGDPNETIAEPPTEVAEQDPEVKQDPISVMAGSLEVTHTDLSFEGPVRPLTFTRTYSSQGNDRSELGSNWAHNWDVRVIPLRHENLPDGVDPFCAGTPAVVTCVYVRTGNDARLYMRDRRDGLFKPQAGSFSHLKKQDSGWLLRGPDGHLQQFDADGYLIYDADRFGNGFDITYELNAWGLLDKALCPNALVHLFNSGTWSVPVGPTGITANSTTCTLLSGLVGRTKPILKSTYALTAGDFVLPANASAELQAARALLVASQNDGIGNGSTWGQRLKRVSRVTEKSGRSGEVPRELVFTYWPDTDTTTVPGANNLRRAGLLRRVTGPAGATVEFGYVAPAIPRRLSEVLLNSVTRADTGMVPAGLVAGPVRTYSFVYSSPSIAGTTLTQAQIDDLVTRYTQYFAKTTGCSFVTYDKCGNPLVPGFMPHPAEEVNRRVDAFLSDVADNLLTISGPNETVETRYEVNPLSLQFDKVKAQRWGSSSVPGMPTTGPNWNTTLPEATFAYAVEGPTGTDLFLDPVIRNRYAYEVPPAGIVAESNRKFLTLATNFTGVLDKAPGTLLIGGSAAGGVRPCQPELEPQERTRLPGYRPTYEYYALPLAAPPAPGPLTDGLVTPGVDLDMPLQRSRLNCAQLAEAQTFDVDHNDLQTWMTGRSGNLYNFESFAGRRSEMNLNANRICAWTKMVDREGAQHVYGFNYHGRTLVSAVKVNGTWKVAETLYNADGNVISQRRVMSGSTPWSPNEGDTRYGYVDGQRVAGPNGPVFQEPAPFYWAQRRNVRAILDRPRGGFVTDEVEGTSTTETTLATPPLSTNPSSVRWLECSKATSWEAQRPNAARTGRRPTTTTIRSAVPPRQTV
jgi:hypothetical protein